MTRTLAIRYFRDLNHNKKLDRKERLSGEMIHTTPQSEAQSSRGGVSSLNSSHGCVHVLPKDRDRFLKAGAFDRGVDLLIHPYADFIPSGWL
jgi:hypothetical protein